MKKAIILLLAAIVTSLSSFGQVRAIEGPLAICMGDSTRLTEVDSSTSGVWSSSNTSIASVTGAVTEGTATVTGISTGVATITYTLAGSYVTASFTVSAAPAAITGTPPTCVGATGTLSDASVGGVWSSSNTAVATVGSTGVVTGVWGGSTVISYIVGAGCPAVLPVTIPSLPDDSIFGASTVCAGATITLTDATTGGAWSSSSVAIATVSSAGVVSGVSAGAATITYALTTACAGTGYWYQGITVGGTTSAGTISGPSTVAAGAPITLSDGSGGTWSSSNTATATVNALSGVVTGVAPGTTVITYAVSGCTGIATTTTDVTVTAFAGISGYVNFPGSGCSGGAKVWLITYDPATLILAAADSATCAGGASIYYQFTGLAADSFRIKAAPWDAGADTMVWGGGCGGPTYHTSSLYWHDADVIYYTTGASDINENINLIAGSTGSGPGFIGGNVMSGANRGTLTMEPVQGLLILLQNAGTGALVQQTFTDVDGNYSFSSLPYGTYFVYPELINYATTPYTGITLCAATPSASSASFTEHTVSRTITPANEAVSNIPAVLNSFVAYPNPTSGKLNFLWTTATDQTAIITITDVMGRQVYNASVLMPAGSGTHEADLTEFTNGLYLVSVRSASITYNNEIEIKH